MYSELRKKSKIDTLGYDLREQAACEQPMGRVLFLLLIHLPCPKFQKPDAINAFHLRINNDML